MGDRGDTPEAGEPLAVRISGDGDGGSTAFVESGDDSLRGRLAAYGAGGVRVRLSPMAGADTMGHGATVLSDLQLVSLRILDEEDDTEGHAIQLRFPSAEEARNFRMRMIAGGALVATLAVASAGVAISQTSGLGSSASNGADTAAVSISADSQMSTFAREREGGVAAAASGTTVQPQTYAQEREGGVAAAASGTTVQPQTYAQEREGGSAAGAGTTVQPQTYAQEREGGSAAGAEATVQPQTYAQEREGGSADEAEGAPAYHPPAGNEPV
ncbi:MAG: hypothetical protein ABR509_04785 [Candidatus Limnocylindria bacterium]